LNEFNINKYKLSEVLMDRRKGKKLLKCQRGITLIELMVVMIILGLLAALVAPKMFSNVGKAKLSAARAQIELFGTALDSFRLDVGRYPTSSEGLEAGSPADSGVGC
jgi:general secretion pathway protein G